MRKLLNFPVIASLLLLVFSYSFIIRNYLVVPQDRYYYGSPYTTPLDFLGSLAIARKGYLGMWQGYLSLWQIHPDRIQNSIIDLVKQEYVIMGHLARLVSIEPLILLLFVRFVLSIVLLYVMYVFIKTITTTKEELHLGFFLALFAVGITWPWEGWSNSAVIAGVGDSIYPIFRYTFIAHHYLIGQITTLLSMIYLSSFFRSKKISFYLRSVICGFCSSIVFLPSALLLVASAWVPYFISFRCDPRRNMRTVMRYIALYSVYTLLILSPVPFIYINVKTFIDTEWMIKLDWKPIHYVYSVGIVYIFSFFALKGNKHTQYPHLFYWAISWIIIHPFLGFLMQQIGFYSIKRIFQTPYMPVFSALSAMGIVWIKNNLTSFQTRIGYLVVPAIILIVIISGYKTYYYTVPIENFSNKQESTLGYPSKNNMEAIWWLRDHTKESDIVMASYNNGILIPAFAGNRTFINPWFQMLNIVHFYPQELLMYFKGTMYHIDVINFYKSHHIAYVFYGQDEQAFLASTGKFPYQGIVPVFTNASVTIYEVPKEWRN